MFRSTTCFGSSYEPAFITWKLRMGRGLPPSLICLESVARDTLPTFRCVVYTVHEVSLSDIRSKEQYVPLKFLTKYVNKQSALKFRKKRSYSSRSEWRNRLLTHVLYSVQSRYRSSHICTPTFLPQCEQPSFTPIQNNRQNYIFIVAQCILKIHWVLHTNKCTNCISYISLKLFTLKHCHCSCVFR